MTSSVSSFILRSNASSNVRTLRSLDAVTLPRTQRQPILSVRYKSDFINRSYSTNKGLRPKGPGPIPLGSAKDQAEFEQLIKQAESGPATNHPDAKTPVPEEFEGDTNPQTGEVGGPKREPVRFGDWSFKGRVTDF
ncbi:putative mitochondrial protein, conserved [Lobosporangium transversale]|uniref:Succinate dehydrogenase assembly factor 4, mitochondrial n=1 Tax=Lobosporangium transversale TaxID=64571 RepID=A0A1Y2GV13_9FUNG|nr:hypothetical protein BCR41DRAFT_351867 [Lobosporangium transversale]KAF9913500.1 putative mitochondrial protein, conserved [Lobosporangium transversale]ORZ19261.1 hypothetical protein BCR41DRAFT_351867 [Lobosporangium transversale]|eukprot:XP_021882429.1 hypothetical protein BCR41DRAFT_351867 [Lobosporangium transversale]